MQRGAIHALVSTATSFKFDGTSPAAAGSGHQAYTVPTNHIITMLSIIVCEQGGVAEFLTEEREGMDMSIAKRFDIS